MRRGKTVVCVSRLHAEKGHRILLEAFRQLLEFEPEALLFLVGTGPEREDLGQCVVRLGLGHQVHFLGWRDDVLSVMAAADVVVHASFHEALPSAVIEALALARPLVATDVSGVRDLVGSDDHGRVVPRGTHTRSRKRYAKPSPASPLLEKARRGRHHVLEYMEAGRIAAAHVACYRQALQQVSHKPRFATP